MPRRPIVPTGLLWQDVMLARARLAQARSRERLRGGAQGEVSLARADLLAALESYAARLTSEGTPVPYRLRDELRLHAALADARR
jgi:hypothetical protein